MQAAIVKQPLGLAALVKLPRAFPPFAFDFERDFFLPPDVVVYDSPVPGMPTDFVRRPELLTVYRAPFPPTLKPTDFLPMFNFAFLPSLIDFLKRNPIFFTPFLIFTALVDILALEVIYVIYETRLRDIRRTQRLTLRQLSELSGVSFSEIDQIEHYNVDPRISTAVLLAKSLKCGLDDLFSFNK